MEINEAIKYAIFIILTHYCGYGNGHAGKRKIVSLFR